MANKGIKGITIEIGGDTKGLNKALEGVNKQSKDLQGELKEVERGLKFDPGNVELIRQKQELLTASIASTSDKLDVLRTAQSQVQAQFDRGDIGVDQYRAFQRELQQTEGDMNRLQGQLGSLGAEQDRLSQTTRQLGTFFEATGTDVEQFTGTLGTRLTQAIRDGSASADQMERALRLMGRQALGAGTDIDQMREALRSADDGANIDEIRRELDRLGDSANEAEEEVQDLSQTLNNAGEKMSGVGSSLTAGLTAPITGAGVAAGLSAKQFEDAATQIQNSLGVTADEAKNLEEVARNVWKAGFGESLEDVSGALIRVKQNIKGIVDDAELERLTGSAIALATTFDSDVNEVTRAGNNLMTNFGISSEKAFDMMAKGAQNGLNFSNELFDNLAEYAPLWSAMGYSAEEMFGVLQRGSAEGVYNLDYLNDIMKEFQIRIKDNSKSTSEAMDGMSQSTLDLWEAQYQGKATVAEVAESVIQDLKSMENQTDANEIAVALFGTKFEDLESKAVYAMLGSTEAMTGFEGAMQGIVDVSEQTFGQRWESMTRNAAAALEPLGIILLDIAEKWIPKIISVLQALATWFANLSPVMQITVLALGGFVAAIGPMLIVFGSLVSIIGTLIPLFATGGAGVTAFGATMAALTGPIGITIAVIAGLATAFVALWQNSETFRTNLTSVFEAIKNVAVTVFETVASFIGEKISQIKAFWDAEGAQILQAAENIFNGIMAVIQFVMPAIKLIIDVVWTAIKQVITGALNVIMGAIKIFSGLFTGDISKMWEGVKQLFFGAINVIIGWISLTFVGGIRSLLANLGKTALSLVKGMWDNVYGVFKTMGGSIRSFTDDTLSKVIGFFRNFVTNVKTQMNNAKQGVVDIWGKAVAFLKGINLKQIGKDIIQGLVNGIGSMGSFVTEKIKEIANSVPQWMKKILGIHSPSRVTDKIGQQTGEGFANGIAKKKAAAIKAAKAVSDAAKKNFESKMKDLALKFKAGKINTTDYIKSLETLKKDYKKVPLAISKVDAEIATLRKKNSKELFEVDKKTLDDKIKYGNLTMDQEVKLLQKMVGQYKKNSEERIYFEDKVKDKLLQVTQEKQRINEKYLSDVQTLNQKHIDEENRLNAEYQKALDDRTKSLYSFAGIFDEVTSKDISGDSLLMNLYSQVSAFQDWQKNITALAKKGIDEGLLAELREMGPKAGAEIAALNTLTDVQLNQYVNLWKEKNALAKGQALNELKGLKADTAAQITELRKETAAQLLVYQDEWKKAMVDTRGKVKDEMKQMPSIGQFAVSGLISGLSAKRKELISVAQQLANDVKGAFQGALDIHSPSRVFHGFGVNINEGLIKGIQDSTSRLNNAMNNVYGSLASSASKSNANQIANQQIINQSSNIDLTSLVGAIISLANRPVETSINMDGRTVASAVSTHQYNDSSIAAMLKGVRLG